MVCRHFGAQSHVVDFFSNQHFASRTYQNRLGYGCALRRKRRSFKNLTSQVALECNFIVMPPKAVNMKFPFYIPPEGVSIEHQLDIKAHRFNIKSDKWT